MTFSPSRISAFIVGFGDIGRRVAALWQAEGGEVATLVRTPCDLAGYHAIPGDLDHPETLHDIPRNRPLLFHFAPPPLSGTSDTRTAHLLEALEEVPPRRIVYISTSGVYGDCRGAWVNEAFPVHPGNDRSRRRVDAERQLTAFARRHTLPLVILRVPGIYGPGRLPLERLRQGNPVVCPDQAPWNNRIHADDLAAIALRAGQDNAPARIYNVSDDQPSSMTDYLYRLADAAGLPRPPCVSLAEAQRTFSPKLLEYLNESRRLDNRRMKTVLGIGLHYPTLEEGLPATLKASV
ncbi:NAD-dependent epimerase/dehydratase [Nitrosococcus halophilus Nc 4]|uniref:NAD-dependent epimerase/dehydratase n=1 Tax=Nitrosococcus halophilus (strain Nc4) TaxID=472759 RepID=D5C4T6_NITHN|nr:SDR family oxidoreductase [Nitrosococcus halophilus]ADE13359.1 NAD-dependent epimerase/dehydratase [Nitrosococcus halophilus Nc 4]